jgi:hypothetical protein
MVSRFVQLALLTVLASAGFACAKDNKARTELVLVADTNIASLDTIRFEVAGGDRNESEEAAPRSDGEPLTLGLVLDKGPLGPLNVSAQGLRAGRVVVERRAVVSFVPGKTLVVELHLVLSCELPRCLSNQTCSERGCIDRELSAEELPEWTGSAPRLGGTLLADAGRGDAGVITTGDAQQQLEAGSDANAGELVTCGPDTMVDLSSDVDHCGTCTTTCKTSSRNMVAVCVAGECAEECRALYGDCDGRPNTGCEQSLLLSTNCGMCGMRCSAGTSCVFGVCR